MYQIKSKIDINSEEYQNNYRINKSLTSNLSEVYEQHLFRSRISSEQKSIDKGKLTVRERINKLVDQDSAFLELSLLAAYNQYNNEFPSAGIVTGIGVIHQKEVVIIANDPSVKGGTYIKETIKKHLRAQEIAMENQLPCVYLVDSGGIFLPRQVEVFPDKLDFGRIFYNQAVMSANKIPQISVVMGSCTAGGAYIPAMSDETIIVRNQGTIFIGGPPLVEAATGEKVSAEDLGGADVHTSISGVADHLAENDLHALEICRNVFESIPGRKKHRNVLRSAKDPLYDIKELYGIVFPDHKVKYDPREIIARIADESVFHEFKERYGTNLVTGFTKIFSRDIGIIANHGFLNSEASLKGTHFIELCNYRKIPILFLQNITGFIVGKEYEHKGIARDGAKMVHAVANSVVPKITIITGGSFGAGNYAMNGRAYNPRFLFLWPNALTGVMGGEQAADVMVTVKRNQALKSGKNLDENEIKEIRNSIISDYAGENSAYYSTSRLWDDGIIDPASTRKILGLTLSVVDGVDIPEPKSGIYRM